LSQEVAKVISVGDWMMGKKTERIMAMLSLIPRKPAKISTDRLMGYLSDAGFVVTQRTIQRDLHEISTTHPIVLDERSKPFGWSYMAGYSSQSASMNPFEALAFIIAAREFSSHLPSGIAQYLAPQELAAKRALESYSSNLATFDKKVARIPRGFSLKAAEINHSILDAVYDGLLREKVLELDYTSKKKVKIHPLGLVFRDQITYLVGTFWNYDDVRQLALHRIKNCVVTDFDIKIPKGFNLQQYEASGALGYLKSGETIKLELKLTSAAAKHLKDTPFSDDQIISESDKNGWVTVSGTVPDREDLRWWILGFGEQVEVVYPLTLRKKISTTAKRMGQLYGNE
jgi:predicted DNA-binding transcriptional regulator YafY